MGSKPANTIASAVKVMRVLSALRGHYFAGVTNQELAKQLNESPSQITRALQTLVATGWAEERTRNVYAPSIAFIQFANSTLEEAKRAEARLSEFRQRVGVSQF